MTPPKADQCPHRHCVETEVPHICPGDPETCPRCLELDDPQQPLRRPGDELRDKAFRVASKRHPEAFPQPDKRGK